MNVTAIIDAQMQNPLPITASIMAIAILVIILVKRKTLLPFIFNPMPKPDITTKDGTKLPEAPKQGAIHRSRNFEYLQTAIILGLCIVVLFSYSLMQHPYLTKENPTPEETAIGLEQRDIGFVVFFLFAILFSVPIGLFLGWIFFDPYQRAKTKRFMMKKNYGIVNFVTKGNKIISKIKNFDHDLLWVDDGVWVLEANRVYLLEKTDETNKEEQSHPLKEGDFLTLSGIPVIFLSIDTMRPLTFHKQVGDANPIDLASTLKGWVMNQLAKNMFFKKTFTAMSLIGIVLTICAVYFSYENYNVLQELKDIMPALTTLAERSGDIVQAGQTIIEQGAG